MTPKLLSREELSDALVLLGSAGLPRTYAALSGHIAALLEEHRSDLSRWEERYKAQGAEVARLHEVLSFETPANNLRGEIARLREEHREALAAAWSEAADVVSRRRRTLEAIGIHPASKGVLDEMEVLLRARASRGGTPSTTPVDAWARVRRNTIDTNTPMWRTGYTIAETAMDTAGVLADDIRALKEPEE